MILLLALLLANGLVGSATWASGASVGRRVEIILRRAHAERGFWGIVVARLPDGRILYQRNAEHLFQPASNMKLFTTAAALEKLGPDFVFRTTVESASAPDASGRVGDLILVGRGDPNLRGRVLPYVHKTERRDPADAAFRELADQIAAKGVKEVTGDIVADDRYFLFEPYSHDWSEEDLEWGYGAPVTAMAFNDNALTIRMVPAQNSGEKATVWLEPVPDYYQIDNRLLTTPAGTTRQIFVERQPDSMRMDVWGQIPVGSQPEEDTVAIAHPAELAAELFRRDLAARGVKVDGKVRVLELSRIEAANAVDPFGAPSARVVLAEHRSAPLSDEIKVVNKVSENLHAEMLLRTMAHELKNYGSLTVGLSVLKEFTDAVGIDPDETYFTDGSGLSREALVAPSAVVKLLVYMTHSPRFPIYFDSLPVAGEDGTLADRFGDMTAEGKIHAKTGTIEHVSTLSGYMELPRGRRLAFSIMGNASPMKSEDREALTDQLAQAIYESFGGPRRRARARTPKR